MKHIHINECPSTFSVLKENISISTPKVLVSTNRQTSGKGRGTNTWDSFRNSIAMSFNIAPHQNRTLSAIEIGVLISDFFNGEISLKWPNDIIKNKKKIGGILIESFDTELLVGIGINTFLEDDEKFGNYKVNAGCLYDKKIELNKEDFCFNLAKYIHANRIEDEFEVTKRFLKVCSHLNEKVEIFDGDNIIGQFKGINPDGSAVIENDLEIKNVYSGSLRLLV